MEHYNALLLIGPTSAGKTPLGAYLQTHGINSTACHHFDFGAHLRRIGAGTWRPHLLDNEDIVVVEKALATGALLEDQQFHIARHVLRSFAEDLKISGDNLIVLNGLPRHAGQARDIADLVRVQTLVHLRGTPETVYRRIQTDAGGDRGARTDDDMALVREILAIFTERTAPLLAFYREQGALVQGGASHGHTRTGPRRCRHHFYRGPKPRHLAVDGAQRAHHPFLQVHPEWRGLFRAG
ncbi:MAG: hypothetical protein ACKVJG_25650 [Candidatus Latescibacterota bacterium]